MDGDSTPLTTAHILRGAGFALTIIGIVWLRTAESYESQMVPTTGLMGVGLLLAWLGQRTLNEAKRAEVEQRIAERDRGEQ